MDIKERIKGIRKAMGLSQQEFAGKVGVSVASVSGWERGLKKPSRLALNKIRDLDPNLTYHLYPASSNTNTEDDIITNKDNIIPNEPSPVSKDAGLVV